MVIFYKLINDDQDDVELFEQVLVETCPDLNLTVVTDGAKLLNLLEVIPKPDVILLVKSAW